jgi:hypothetical protein
MDKNKGIILVPYILKNKSTTINSKLVWHSNFFINTWLKIKRFFSKEKDPLKRYSEKRINSKFYTPLKIEKKK